MIRPLILFRRRLCRRVLSRRAFSLAVLLVAAVVLGACAETQFLISTAKRLGDGQPKEGEYKIGEPYQIGGVWYYPAADYGYDQTGIASWYGPKFHGRDTANGEVFDMNEVSAAHKTLPLPSFVTVTNLENGRRLNVRVNDRGPFAHGRIIDMSRRAAQLLGFDRNGTARVRVRVLPNESRAVASRMKGEAELASIGSPITISSLPKPKVMAEALPPPPGGSAAPRRADSGPGSMLAPEKPVQLASRTETAGRADGRGEPAPKLGVVETVPAVKTRIYIQAGAFAQYENANRVRAVLGRLGPVRVSPVLVNGQDLFRVRVGPMVSVAEADKMLEWMIQLGYPHSNIIVD